MSRSLLLLGALALAGCGGGPRSRVANAVDQGDLSGALAAYEDFRRTEGSDRDVLGRVAGLLLEREASSEDAERRRAAVVQLGLAGTSGEPILTRLSRAEGSAASRLDALSALARRGHEDARLALRALADSDDPEVVAASVEGMDPELDGPLLRSLLASPHTGTRAAAARILAPLASEAENRAALEEVARVDAEPSVRAAAVRALGRSGAAAVPALRERLGDPASSVRLAAVSALIEADREQALLALGSLLEVTPSPAGIEAARLIAQLAPVEGSTSVPTSAPSAARAFLRRALASESASLRSQAGVALAGLPASAESPIDAVRTALAQEEDPEVRLALARALLTRDVPTAHRALEGLLDADGMPRVQAAALLAQSSDEPGNERAREVLRRVIASDAESILRRTAVRALAREAMEPDAVRASLRDDDAMVRIYAAGGILAAAAAG